jgi:hypothetical protein
VRQLAALTVKAEQIEAQMVMGQQINISTLCTLASTVMRLSSRLGLERAPGDATPTLSNYLNATYKVGDAS